MSFGNKHFFLKCVKEVTNSIYNHFKVVKFSKVKNHEQCTVYTLDWTIIHGGQCCPLVYCALQIPSCKKMSAKHILLQYFLVWHSN